MLTDKEHSRHTTPIRDIGTGPKDLTKLTEREAYQIPKDNKKISEFGSFKKNHM